MMLKTGVRVITVERSRTACMDRNVILYPYHHCCCCWALIHAARGRSITQKYQPLCWLIAIKGADPFVYIVRRQLLGRTRYEQYYQNLARAYNTGIPDRNITLICYYSSSSHLVYTSMYVFNWWNVPGIYLRVRYRLNK